MRGIDDQVRRLRRLGRAGAALAAAMAITALLLRWGTAAGSDLRALPSSPAATPADAIADVAAVLALAAWLWLLVGALLTVVEALPGAPKRRLAPRIAPAAWRRLVISVLGVGILSAPLGAAQARPGDAAYAVDGQRSPDRSASTLLDPARAVSGLPLPDRPFSRLPSQRLANLGDDRTAPARVTVRPGDSLWAIAERRLGVRATDQAIATEWRRWYAANRAVIGPNPDLIHPGMVLHAPTRKAAS